MSREIKTYKMKKTIYKLVLLLAFVALFISCTSINQSMREPNTKVNLNKSDFTLSDQVIGEASSTKIIGIDWSRFFTQKTGSVENGAMTISAASIPVVGDVIADKTANYALYNIMTANPGFDVVFYPQYETKVVRPILGIGFLTKITTVKAKVRLGKLNK